MTVPHPHTSPEEPSGAPTGATEDLEAAGAAEGYGMRDLASEIGEGVKDELLGWVYTALMLGGMILAWVLPIGGLAIGVISLVLAIRSGRSLFMPIAIAVLSVVAWIVGKSPLGMLPLVLSVL